MGADRRKKEDMVMTDICNTVDPSIKRNTLPIFVIREKRGTCCKSDLNNVLFLIFIGISEPVGDVVTRNVIIIL